MKKIYKSIFFYGLLATTSLIMGSCGDAFDYPDWQIIDDKQSDTSGGDGIDMGDVSDEVLEGELRQAMEYVIDFREHKYQYQRNTNIDVFAGYCTVSKSKFDFGQPLYHTYDYPNGYYGGPLGESQKLFPQLYHAYFFAESHGNPEWKAIAQILYAYSMHELVDFFGVIPYNDYRKLKETNPLEYLSCEDTYKAIFTDLEEAIATLKEKKPSAEMLKRVEGEKEGYSKGDWKNWVRFANSIRLRMALNMVKVNPGDAQTIAESAANDEIGLLTEDFGLPTDNGSTYQHPLHKISAEWEDSRLGASLENIMKRYNNPLLEVWFSKNGAVINSKTSGKKTLDVAKECVGMRQGCSVDPSPAENGYKAFSKFQVKYMPRNFFKVTEVLFLLSEAKLRNWNVGGTSAKDFYEQGIRKVFEENGLSGAADAYLKQTAANTKIVYKDYYQPEFSETDQTRGVQVGVKWDEGDSDEVKLEKSVTQKYIANFPQSAEAWTTFRRTGYPRLFPVVEEVNGVPRNWPDKSFDNELQIRRIPFGESTSNEQVNIPNIEVALGGDNTAGTRVWWDVPTEGRDENNRIIPKNF